MSVKQVDRTLGEALYQYINGKLETLPLEIRDKKALASALLYIQETYNMSPQQVVEKLKEKKQNSTVSTEPIISGTTLKKLLSVMEYLRRKYYMDSLQLVLRRNGILVAGSNRDVIITAEIPKGEGYVAPSNEETVEVYMSWLEDSSKRLNAEKIFQSNGFVYAVMSGRVGRIGDKFIREYEKIDINKLEREISTSGNHIELHVKPEVFGFLHKLRKYNPGLYVVKEEGKPALYVELWASGNYFRVPDQAIEYADVDPYMQDGAYNYFSYENTGGLWPEPSEKTSLRTKTNRYIPVPLKVSAKQEDGIVYNFYYKPSFSQQSEFNYYRFLPTITYQVDDDAFPYMLASLDESLYDIHVMPSEDKLIFIGTPEEIRARTLPVIVELDATAKFIGNPSELSNLHGIYTMDRLPGDKYSVLIPQTFNFVKDVGGKPQIGLNLSHLSLWGLIYGLRSSLYTLKDRDEKHLMRMLEWYHSLNQSNSTVIELSGADFVDKLKKFNSLGTSYSEFRLSVKPDGEAVLEVVGDAGGEEKTIWKKTVRASNPPDKELSYSDKLDFVFNSDVLPFIYTGSKGSKYQSRIPFDLLRKAKIEILIPKTAPPSFLSEGHPVILKMRIGNSTMYSSLFIL
jgi:hypothetical protein